LLINFIHIIMEISILESYEEISRNASDILIRQLEMKKELLLCAATGNTPGRTYELLAREYASRPGLFDELSVLKLDEWGGLPMTDPGTCESYLQTRLLSPLQISRQRYLSFCSDPTDPELECRRMQAKLATAGPIDCCVLGLGMNGHIGLNEPADFLQSGCHIARLSEATLQHSMVSAMDCQPSFGLTLGMADILQARMILLLVSGPTKKKITRELLSKRVTTNLPASFLWLHGNTICLLDRDAA
jgi:galactosamine-6-phosphate isomerase